jgi:YHS domain-containing protein
MIEQDQQATIAGGRDPVCGMWLSERQAIRFTFGHAVLVFCGAECLELFRHHPDAYLRP